MKVKERVPTSIKDSAYRIAIIGALTQSNGKLSPAARLVRLSRPTTLKYARQFGLWPWKPAKNKVQNGKAKKIQK